MSMNKRFVSETLQNFSGSASILTSGTYFFQQESDHTFHIKTLKFAYIGSGAVSLTNFFSEAGALSSPFIVRVKGNTQSMDLISGVNTSQVYEKASEIYAEGNFRLVQLRGLDFQLDRNDRVECILPSTLAGTTDLRITVEGYEY